MTSSRLKEGAPIISLLRSRPFWPIKIATCGTARLFVAIEMLCDVAVSTGEAIVRGSVMDVSTYPREVTDEVGGSDSRRDKKLLMLSSFMIPPVESRNVV